LGSEGLEAEAGLSSADVEEGVSAVKKVSVCLAAAALLVLCSVLVGTTAGHAGIQGRPGKIAFLRTVGDGPSGLFVTGADGSGPRRLTPGGLDVASYEWVPDGSRIAYLDRQGALRLVRPDGTGRELLARSSTLRSPWVLSWSPDGKAIAVLQRDPGTPPPPSNSSPHFRIVVIPTGGGAPRRLPSGDAQIIDWSPHGDEIVYGDGTGRQRIIRTDGSKPRPFFHPPPKHGKGTPTWSPDGTHVGFTGHVRHGRYPHPSEWYDAIYVADADGSGLHLVTSHAYNEYGFAWSPDGRWILYGRENREGIYVIGADGRNNHRLTRDSPRGVDFGALTWAPNGRSIAYATDRTGNGDIYVIDAGGHNKVRLTSSAASEIDPSWEYSRTPCCP
jgi:Tol biopolymer transport system component